MKIFSWQVVFFVAFCFYAVTAVSAQDFPGMGPPGSLRSIVFEGPAKLAFHSPNDRVQLVVAGQYSSGQVHDLTHDVTYSVQPAGVLQVASDGIVTPVADGEATITARTSDGKTTSVACTVENYASPRPINFANEITPIFTKLGCNAGGCHGKSGGQNGFRLSLLGFYPKEDYEWLVKEHRGRRIFQAAPEFSLLLTKPTGKLPHGGGRRLDEDAYEYELLVRWIEQGMPFGREDDPTVERIEVLPKTRDMNRNTRQQLRVIAHYSDDSIRDVTRLSSFEANDTEMCESTTTGRVTIFDRPGDAVVMVRFQGQVDVFRAVVPLGVAVSNLPPAKNVVDQFVFAKLKQLGIPASGVCDDATFVRRAYLDITGRLPSAEEARAFAEDKNPQKRELLVDFLLDSPGYGDYFGNKWTMLLRNKRLQNVAVSYRFHDFVRRSIQKNVPYDQFARSILAASGDVEVNPAASWFTQVNTSTAQLEDTAQMFLGMRIQCARCHHHPFERWSQNDYYGFEAFFSRVGLRNNRKNLQRGEVFHQNGLATARNPRSGQDLRPTGLGGEPIEVPTYEDPRNYLVDWMAQPDNPFFARAFVNRYWKHFFGRGIVDPEDDMRVTNPPSNPELLDALAKHFIDSKFNMKQLVRTLCTSMTYQLSSEPNEYNAGDKQNFSRFYPRRMNAEPLYDAINQVAATQVNFANMPRGTRSVQLPDSGFNDYFLMVFGKPQAESACECERSSEANLAQSLHLLNSTDIQSKLSASGGRCLTLVENEQLTEEERITEMYYAAFARPPREKELAFVVNYIGLMENKRNAYEDLMWALFNTKEFLFVR